MKNLESWTITLIVAGVFIFGIAYYKILDAIVNVVAFIISLTIIFLILILVIIFSPQDNKKKMPHFEKPKIEFGSEGLFSGKKSKTIIEKTSPKKLKAIKKK